MTDKLKFPAPYFGGKAMIADKVWAALGQPKQYMEPFFGSGAVLLARPNFDPTKYYEIICDADGFIANVWRALQAAPDEVAKVCDWPINHADLSARKRKLIASEKRLLENLIADDKWYDVEAAGYWIWAASCWIGSELTKIGQIPHLAGNHGINALGQIPRLAGNRGINALGQIPHLTGNKGVQEPYNTGIYTWFRELSERLRYVKVVCGDWTRICGGNWQDRNPPVGIFFDPPYGTEAGERDENIYQVDSVTVAHDVREWSIKRGSNPNYRIVIAGYGEHEELKAHGWTSIAWSAQGGYSKIGKGENNNRHKETLWLSPHCLKNKTLFDN